MNAAAGNTKGGSITVQLISCLTCLDCDTSPFSIPWLQCLRDSPFIPTFCQNLMIFHQTIDLNTKFRYSLIINDHQIYETHQNSPQIHQFQQVGVKILTKWPATTLIDSKLIHQY
jgi:hypothetical protein